MRACVCVCACACVCVCGHRVSCPSLSHMFDVCACTEPDTQTGLFHIYAKTCSEISNTRQHVALARGQLLYNYANTCSDQLSYAKTCSDI